ncbi:MAG TPA: cytochrome C [Thermoanaerobaculia bacterium]|jgi:hypothetical protein|nr:cytochrome C [Thermoanaerobaculia bacterium]
MRLRALIIPFALVGLALALAPASEGQRASANSDAERIAIGFRISPVHLNLHNKDRDLVGLGSYIINAQAACNDCHTSPPYADGGNPFMGQPKHFNSDRYLAGGTAFGPYVSDNLTPDANGLPAGLTLPEFKNLMRTGHAPDLPAGTILHVMPWPVFQSMTDRDLRAIYEYLRSIPHLDD